MYEEWAGRNLLDDQDNASRYTYTISMRLRVGGMKSLTRLHFPIFLCFTISRCSRARRLRKRFSSCRRETQALSIMTCLNGLLFFVMVSQCSLNLTLIFRLVSFSIHILICYSYIKRFMCAYELRE